MPEIGHFFRLINLFYTTIMIVISTVIIRPVLAREGTMTISIVSPGDTILEISSPSMERILSEILHSGKFQARGLLFHGFRVMI